MSVFLAQSRRNVNNLARIRSLLFSTDEDMVVGGILSLMNLPPEFFQDSVSMLSLSPVLMTLTRRKDYQPTTRLLARVALQMSFGSRKDEDESVQTGSPHLLDKALGVLQNPKPKRKRSETRAVFNAIDYCNTEELRIIVGSGGIHFVREVLLVEVRTKMKIDAIRCLFNMSEDPELVQMMQNKGLHKLAKGIRRHL